MRPGDPGECRQMCLNVVFWNGYVAVVRSEVSQCWSWRSQKSSSSGASWVSRSEAHAGSGLVVRKCRTCENPLVTHQENARGWSRPGGKRELLEIGSKGRKGDMSQAEYHTESQTCKLWCISGLKVDGQRLWGIQRRVGMAMGAQLGNSKRTHRGVWNVAWSRDNWAVWVAR